MAKKSSPAAAQARHPAPAHILQLMVALAAPELEDTVCDPFCGDGSLLVAAAEHVRALRAEVLESARQRTHFRSHMFHGFDADETALEGARSRLEALGIDSANLRRRELLGHVQTDRDPKYTLLLAAPAGAATNIRTVAADLQKIVRTQRTELLGLARCMRMVSPEGRAVVLVPESLLCASSKAHRALRSSLVRNHKLEAVVRLPRAVPMAHGGAAAAILVIGGASGGATREVWYYDVRADGFSLDDNRMPLVPAELLGPVPAAAPRAEQHELNNLPDVLSRWRLLHGNDAERDLERSRARSAQSFCVPLADIEAADFNLGLERYQRLIADSAEQRRAHEILAELAGLEAEIFQGMKTIVGMLK